MTTLTLSRTEAVVLDLLLREVMEEVRRLDDGTGAAIATLASLRAKAAAALATIDTWSGPS